ncbi:F-actin-capping protein subunit alpha [Myxozyma melibiosi]|uniref:F-actin-capping protein subunit alpha n=1 Tax=Myxozyma melibiosi TaxID=54550 RepID=A0ABR1F444_9ASCO
MSVSAKINAASAFLTDAPPGEIKDVYEDIKALVEDDEDVLDGLADAFEKYNLEQFVTVKVPGSDKTVVISRYNMLEDGGFYDAEVGKKFKLDHRSLKVSDVESYEGSESITSLTSEIKSYVLEHYPSPSSYGVFESPDGTLAVVIVGNKYSPHNFWNGRWRSSYVVDQSSKSITGTIALDVHYYEDGNVRLTTSKPISTSYTSTAGIAKAIAAAERGYQEDINREFAGLSDGAFKSLRRQLPVTRSKIEWGKSIGAYRLGQDIGGGRSK